MLNSLMLRHAVILLLTLSLSCNPAKVDPPTPLMPVPSAAQLAWHELEQYAFIHFTTNTFTDKEWGFGDEPESIFNPTELNVNQWVQVIKEAGLRAIILTAKHHDGFCLWPSEYTEHSIKNSPYKNGNGDLVKELAEASRREGLLFGIYLSPWDRNHPEYGRPAYVTYYRNQLKEIFTNYGPVFEMWFDGANGGDGHYGGANETRRIDGSTYYDWPGTISMVRKMEPSVLFFSDAGPDIRWVGNERGIAGETNWNTISNDTLFAGKAGIEQLLNTGHPEGTSWIPAEVDVSIRPGWFYHASQDTLVKTPEKLFEIYLTSVGRGSNLLLNIPPDRRGLIHERDVEALRGWKALVEQAFSKNLANGAVASASSVRGNARAFGAHNLTDSDKETYWATDDDTINASVEITLNQPTTISYLLLSEYIKLGQRVKSFKAEALVDNEWMEIAKGTTIGYKRILKTAPVESDKVRVTIVDAKACPALSAIELY